MRLIYKFGGASVKDAAGIRNLTHIVRLAQADPQAELFVVISAMGKTTNALERLLQALLDHQPEQVTLELQSLKDYHLQVAQELFSSPKQGRSGGVLDALFARLDALVSDFPAGDYDSLYDLLVPYGELLSTTLITAYLKQQGLDAAWLDMRQLLRTDATYRDASVDQRLSQRLIREAADFGRHRIYVGQGFIGGTNSGHSTTLGREGSDYTAALVGNYLQADSVSIWKDVPGILNADPRIFQHTVLIPEMSYQNAVELAYSGAQVIHPKTIRPLEQAGIPLFVRPFMDPEATGSVIQHETSKPIQVPVMIVRREQMLITVRPLDFSFILEESLPRLFSILHSHRLKIRLIQSSAVSVSISVDHTRYAEAALEDLRADFRVSYNTDLELLTVRHTDQPEQIACDYIQGREVLIHQHTRRTARYLIRL